MKTYTLTSEDFAAEIAAISYRHGKKCALYDNACSVIRDFINMDGTDKEEYAAVLERSEELCQYLSGIIKKTKTRKR